MKRFLFVILTGILAISVQAQEITLSSIIDELNIWLGGLFGLYFLLLLVRIYFERRKVGILQDMRFDLDQLNQHYHLRTSRSRNTLGRRLSRLFRQ